MFRSHTGFTLVEIVLVVVVVVALGGAGWAWWQANQTGNGSVELDNASSGQEESVQNDEADSGQVSPIFQAKELKPGDRVGVMEAVSIERANESFADQTDKQELSDDNVSVVFKGEVTVSGTYVKRTGILEGPCLEKLDDTSRSKLPRVEDDKRRNFCFSNEDEAEAQLTGNEGQQVTVAVDDYTYLSYPSEGTNTARLVEVE